MLTSKKFHMDTHALNGKKMKVERELFLEKKIKTDKHA